MTSVKDNLLAARALIDTPEKWGKDQDGSLRGKSCVGIALGEVTGNGMPEYDAVRKAIVAALPAHFASNTLPIVFFNDHPDTTHADILALFDRAIAACDEQVAA